MDNNTTLGEPRSSNETPVAHLTNKPLVSVGIPFFNCEKCILDAIRSIFAQTYANWELILVDDGSSDQGLELANSISDPRVRVLPPDGKNKKLAARLNQISAAANGQYIARMDADDLCHPERIERQLGFLIDNPDIDVVGSSSCILGIDGLPASKMIVENDHQQMFSRKFTKGVSIVHPSIMAKTGWFRKWPYDESNLRSEDYELWLRTEDDCLFANIPDILYFTNEYRSYSLKKYAHSKNTRAKIIWKYASKEQGYVRACYYSGRAYTQVCIHLLARILGFSEKLIQRRYSDISENEKYATNEILYTIKNSTISTHE